MIENVAKAVIPVAQEVAQKTSETFFNEIIETFLHPKLKKMKNKPKNTEDILEILEEYYKKACLEKNKWLKVKRK